MKLNRVDWAAALILAVLSCGQAEAGQVHVLGSRSCADWVGSRKFSIGPGAIANNNWMAGYLSGLASASNDDILKGMDMKSVEFFVTQYCKGHPLSDMVEAGNALYTEAKQRR